MKVLIVDDSSTMRKIVMRTLRQAGFEAEVVEAGDGVEGLAQLDGGAPDLIFSDVNMPNMNGIEFLKELRGKDGMGEVPVVMVTTEGGQDSMNQAMELGANGYVVKPFTPDKLKDVLSDVMK